MQYSAIFKRAISGVISFNLIFTSVAQSAITAISDQNRTTDIIINITKSGAPSELPVANTSTFFDTNNIHLIDNFDLSSYAGKKIFLGYGVYDGSESNCKFVEKPGKMEMDYRGAFAKLKSFNQHSYGISNNRMTYHECQLLADDFGGHVIAVDSAAENGFLSGTFTSTKISDLNVENVWIGAKKQDCMNDYMNEFQMKQDYTNWKTEYLANNCDDTKLNIKGDTTGKWDKTSADIPAYCVVEFDSPEYRKSLKICAPWWKVIREYSNDTPGLYNATMLKNINQADIPIQVMACTKYSDELVVTPPEGQITRDVQCTTYYSKTAAPECVRDMMQPQCFVDECDGYIKNACRLVSTETIGKGYVKGEVSILGSLVETKVKDKIKTNSYACPPSPPSSKECIEQSSVVIFPKECPGSNCEGLKECLINAGLDKVALDACSADPANKCIKIYGGRDIPPVIDPVTHELISLKGKCPSAPISDGSVLDFPVNIQDKTGKKCVEFEKLKKEKEAVEKCEVERPYEDLSVDLSLTTTDAYENSPDCVRMDEVHTSQSLKNVVFSIKTMGYFRTKVSKVFINRDVETVFDGGQDEYQVYGANPLPAGVLPAPGTSIQPSNTTTQKPSDSLDCSAYDGSSAWMTKNVNLFDDPANPATDPTTGEPLYNSDTNVNLEDLSGSTGLVTIPSASVPTEAICSGYGAAHGFSVSSYTYSTNPNGDHLCVLKVAKVGTADSEMSAITKLTADSMKFTFKSALNMSDIDCTKKAICLDGYYNEGRSTSSSCEVTTGAGTSPSYIDKLDGPPPAPLPISTGGGKSDCIPIPATENASSHSTDGLESIFIVEDYIRGGFGYYSNYLAWDPFSNMITVATDSDPTGKQLLLPEMSKITDKIQYQGLYHHVSYKAKKPDAAQAAIGSVLATSVILAATAVYMVATTAATFATIGTVLLAVPGIGWIILAVLVVIFVVLYIFLAKSKSMDRQYTEWHVYKDVRKDLYYSGLYETRIKDTTTPSGFISKRTAADDGANYINYVRLTYWHTRTDTGRDERGPFMDSLNNILKQKNTVLLCGGIEQTEINNVIHPDEKSINYGHPSCQWYQPGCEKSKDHYAELVTNLHNTSDYIFMPDVKTYSPYNSALTNKPKINKVMTTVYIGAVNTLVILVPYAGDYKLEAFNKYDTNETSPIATSIIHEQTFANVTTPLSLKYAQVNFGLTMQMAPGNDPAHACKNDKAVEWGGGVSGVFFENQVTPDSKDCEKSNDAHVKDESMTKIKVTPGNLNRGFVYNLTKPMPFPNRVWIASINDKEVRKYRCYKDWPECTDKSFKEVVK